MSSSSHSSPPWGLTTKAIVAVAGLLLGALVIWRFRNLIPPLVIAAILAYLLNPLINLTSGRLRWSRGRAVLLIYGVLLVAWGAGGVVLGFVTVEQTQRLISLLPDLIPQAISQSQEVLAQLSAQPLEFGPYTFSAGNLSQGIDFQSLSNQAYSLTQPAANWFSGIVFSVAQNVFSSIGLGLMVLVVSIYIAQDIPRIGNIISDIAHQPGYREDADRLMAQNADIWNAYLRGQVVLALVIGVVVSVVLSILGVRFALALGLLAGLLEFLPIVGPTISTVTAVLVALFQTGNTFGLEPIWFGVVVLAVMLLIQQLENSILVPRIVGNALDLHPLVILVGVLMGASLANILGAILAAPVLATIKLLGNYAWRKMLDLPPFPKSEQDDGSPDKKPPAPQPGGFWGRIQEWVGSRRRAD